MSSALNERPRHARRQGERTIYVLAAIGILKATLSLTSVFVIDLSQFRTWYFLAHVAVFAGAGVALLVLGRADHRAVVLGVFFVLFSTAWSDRLLVAFAENAPTVAAAAHFVARLQVAAFTAFFMWMFVREFPQRWWFTEHARLLDVATKAALVIGAALFLANALPLETEITASLRRSQAGSWYWPLIFGVMLPAFAFAYYQMQHSPLDEKRRVRIVLASVVLGFLPEFVLVLGSAISPTFDQLTDPDRSPAVYLISGIPRMIVPFAIAYAVLVHKALDLRLIVRKAVHYGLARVTILSLVLLPFVIATTIAYTRRNETLNTLFQGVMGVVIASALVLGATMSVTQRRLLKILDKRFFREQYDARRILAALVDRGRTLHDTTQMATIVPAEIDRALHLQSVALMLVDPRSRMLNTPTRVIPPIPASAQLLKWLRDAGGMLELDPEQMATQYQLLPTAEQRWLADADVRLMIAVSSRDAESHGVLVLGEKRSELPYSHEDKQLLHTVADMVALSLGRLGTTTSAPVIHAAPSEGRSEECTNCGFIEDSNVSACSRCGGELTTTVLPHLLAGKYRPIERIGQGGMGIVYRAVDESLNRDVAIKTLPRPAPQLAVRIRREARAMAAVAHPNLGAIYAVESWNGIPLLVVELLKGTLESRLQSGPLSIRDALTITSKVARGVQCLHEAGILHRDIKPSNIAFATDGTPKLLDFGLVGIQSSQNAASIVKSNDAPVDIRTGLTTSAGMLIGTLPYLSPEAIKGEHAAPSFDLWALSLVAYESLSGHHPFMHGTQVDILTRIARYQVPDIREFIPDAPHTLADFFRRCFHPNTSMRPRSAREWWRTVDYIRRATITMARDQKVESGR